MNNKGADQTARMHRLVCAFVVCKQQSQGVSHGGPYDVEAHASWPPPGYAPGVGNKAVDDTANQTCNLYGNHEKR